MFEPQEYIYQFPTSKISLEPARFWRRFAVFLIDFLFFMFAIYNPFMSIYLSRLGIDAEALTVETISTSEEINSYLMLGSTVSELIFLMYFVILEQMFGFTIGGYFLKVKVLTNEGKKPSIFQSILRNITKSLFLPFIFVDSLGFIFFRKRFTELLTGTEVFYVPMLHLDME